jgi:acyl transferase domain-containing protein
MSTDRAAAPQPPPDAALSPLKRAFLALEAAHARIGSLEGAAREPVAVVGMGVRAPGGVEGPEGLWRLLDEGRDATGPVPADRWDAEATYDPDPERPGKIATRAGGFLSGPVDRFDAPFFGISPREAQGMDPQQRLLLEVSWEALEHAGLAPDRLERSSTGVYFGVTSSDYTYLQLESGDPALLDAHFTSGAAHSMASGRLSYLLGLQGPSVTIDTACSSSLVAVHLACQALRAGECRAALAGGVNLILAPNLFVALSRARMLAPDGRCKTFDAAADGFARGEGCGVVVLKRLADARADGDRVLAVIRGSAVNQDGPSSGLTAPSGPAQEAVIREALARAGVTPGEIGYVEAHGTGTQLGDPLEVRALGAVFGPGRDPARPLWIGSVKTNVGHLEGAAGVVGLVKVVLSLQHRSLPAHLHFRNPSPHIPWAELPVRVAARGAAWEPLAGRRIAGVSSFGFSGTNAHVVLEEAPEPAAAPADDRPAHLFPLSARDPRALAALAARYAVALAATPAPALADVCFTAGAGRAHLAARAAVVAPSLEALRERLAALADGREAEGLRAGRSARRDPPRVAFLFTGQGAQHAGMARELHRVSPVFREALDRCVAALAPHLPGRLEDVLWPAETVRSPIDETAWTQPALFAVEVALAELWRSFGLAPTAVMGHSVGELAAAHVAGVLSLEDAARLVAVRGRLMQSLPAGGAMAALSASEPRVAAALAGTSLTGIAATNAPEQTVISGPAAEVEAVCRALAAEGVTCRPLTVSHAFHSPLVEPILDAFEREAAAVAWSPPRLRVVSNLTGKLASGDDLTDPRYWRRHVREPVRFAEGLRALAALKPDLVVEVGPHPTLLGFASATLGEAAPALVPSLRKGRPDWGQVLEGLAEAYLAGADVDWRAVHRGAAPRRVALPTYPFQRERCWFQARPRASSRPGGEHPLLGARVRSAGAEVIHEARVASDGPAFVAQHRVQGRVIAPAAAYLEGLAAAGEIALRQPVSVEEITLHEALALDDEGPGRLVQVVCGAPVDGAAAATVSSAAEEGPGDGAWTRHASATVRPARPRDAGEALDALRTRLGVRVDPASIHTTLEARGIALGPAFRVVRELWAGEGEVLGALALGPEAAAEARRMGFHPLLLDGCLQVVAAALPAGAGDAPFLPLGAGRFQRHAAAGEACFAHATVRAAGPASVRADVRVFAASGAPVAELVDLQLGRVGKDALRRAGERRVDGWLLAPAWRPAPPGDAALAAPEVLARAGEAALDGLRASVGLDAYDAFLPRLEATCADLTAHALRRLGWAPAPGARVTAAALADRLGVAGRHRRLFARLLAILAEAGWLAREGETFTVVRALDAADPAPALARLAAECPAGEAELALTSRTGLELAAALRGERDPLQLLFPGGDTGDAERLYRDSPTARLYGGLVAEVVAEAARAPRGGRPLRILEVGAGTGGTTAHVAARLPRSGVEYTFTDVGPLFVARARERLAPAFPFLRFQPLDLEREPVEQGLAPASFDVVLASNVVHATADLARTLGRLRGLLAPGGLLVMLEVTAPQRWFDLTVGLTEGWWAFTDVDLRPEVPTLDRAQWLALLGRCGFDALAALPASPPPGGALALQSVLLARAGGSPARAAPRRLAVVARPEGAGASLAERLRARGDAVTVLAETDADALAAVEPAPDAVVHAAALDAPAGEGAAPGAAAALAGSVLAVAQALLRRPRPPRLVVLTRGAASVDPSDRFLAPEQAAAWGLLRTLRAEHPELACAWVDVAPGPGAVDLDALAAELDAAGAEPEVALRAAGRRVPRLSPLRAALPPPPAAPRRLVSTTPGDLEGLRLVPLERRAPGPGEVELSVEATGLNFKDVLSALGMYPGDPGPLGGECAGRVVAVGPGVEGLAPGDAVLAVAGGSLASHVVARAHLVARRPAAWTAEEAAAFPIAYVTAEFCLGHVARLRAGERVLVHAGAGGVGLAAVHLARRAGAEVFATAGAPWKRALLEDLGVAHVLDSRSPAFADAVLERTAGRGVDVVLNSLSGELVDASWRALARGGRFVELGKRGVKDAAWVAARRPDAAMALVDWGETAARDPALVGGLLARLVADAAAGALPPLPRHAFALEDAPAAFGLMAAARHAGKIVLRHGPAGAPPVRADGTYLVTGGLSGLGPAVARWLAERGAGRLVLVGRRGPTPQSAPLLAELRERGVEVVAEALDVTDEAALRALLRRLRAGGPPLRGVVHSAGVLDDAALLQQDPARLARVLAPKAEGGRLLDRATRADALDLFVLFSSVASVLGSPGQANHSAANAVLDVLARDRAARGLPAVSVNWGPWSEVGVAVEHGTAERAAARGLAAVSPAQGLAALERLLAAGEPQAAVLPVDWGRFLGGRPPPPFLLEVAGAAGAQAAGEGRGAAARPAPPDLRGRLDGVPAARWPKVVGGFVRERALKALGLDPARAVDPRTPLGELGLDSLLAVELRNTLAKALGAPLPATLLFDHPTIDALTAHLLDLLGSPAAAPAGAPPPPAPAGAAAPPGLVGATEELSDEEVERRLAARAGRSGG